MTGRITMRCTGVGLAAGFKWMTFLSPPGDRYRYRNEWLR